MSSSLTTRGVAYCHGNERDVRKRRFGTSLVNFVLRDSKFRFLKRVPFTMSRFTLAINVQALNRQKTNKV